MKGETVFETDETAVKPHSGFTKSQASKGLEGCETELTIYIHIIPLF
jgi:hypothetical protein